MAAHQAVASSQASGLAARLGAKESAAIEPLGRGPYRAGVRGRRRMRSVQSPDALSKMSQEGDSGAQGAIAWGRALGVGPPQFRTQAQLVPQPDPAGNWRPHRSWPASPRQFGPPLPLHSSMPAPSASALRNPPARALDSVSPRLALLECPSPRRPARPIPCRADLPAAVLYQPRHQILILPL